MRQISIIHYFFFAVILVMLGGCQTTQTAGIQDFSNGIDVSVAATEDNPAYRISETVGAAGTGFAYMLEKSNGRWRMTYDSFDAKAFAKSAGDVAEVPEGSEVIWTDGKRAVVYFGTEPLAFSRQDGSFQCPKKPEEPGHRACRSQFAKPASLLGGLSTNKNTRPFVLDFEEIKLAIEDTGIVKTAKRRVAMGKK